MYRFLRHLALFALLTGFAHAGGGPLSTLIVVNDNDPDSLSVGRYYADQRKIPDAHILHLTLSATGALTLPEFTNLVETPLDAYLSSTGLDAQITHIVFTWFTPYTIRKDGNNANGLTSAIYYGYKDAPVDPPCDLNEASNNSYAFSEAPLIAQNLFGYRIASLLTSDSVTMTRTLIDRSVSADFSNPSGQAFFLRTTDNNRNVRWPQFDEAIFRMRQQQPDVTPQWLDANAISGKTNVLAYLTGDQIIPNITNNTYFAGALADHLTSFGGLLNPFASQMSIKEWIHAGCVGSYGTITEPCAYTNKFPQALTHYYYTRGFSMGESYMMGLQNPYQGILLGDPLCQPFATPLNVSATGVVPGETRSGTIPITVTASSIDTNRWIQRIELFVDGLFYGTITNVVVEGGNQVGATIDGSTRTYTVNHGEDLSMIASGLESRLNQAPNIQSTAEAGYNTVLLRQDARGVPGAGITYSASASAGSASQQTVHAYTRNDHYLETTAHARQQLTLVGSATVGSSISATITRTDGQSFTHTITAGFNDTRSGMMGDLLFAIRNDINLQGTNGCNALYILDAAQVDYTEIHLVARSPGWNGFNLAVDFDVSGFLFDNTDYNGPFSSNIQSGTGRGMMYCSVGRPTLTDTLNLNTSQLADGPHTLSFVAYEGTATRTQGQTNIPFTVDNHNLEVELTFPSEGRTFLQGELITAAILASTDVGSVTSIVLYVEGKALPAGPLVVVPELPGSFTTSSDIYTSTYAVGTLRLQAEAKDSFGRTSLSEIVEIELLRNDDGDTLADAWEVMQYNDIHLYTGADDPDGDTRDNFYEYITDTHPTNPASFFDLSINQSNLLFYASSNRWYTVEENSSSNLQVNAWQALPPENFSGVGSSTNVPFLPGTNEVNRFRIRVTRP